MLEFGKQLKVPSAPNKQLISSNNRGSLLNMKELAKALIEFNLDITDQQIIALFEALDTDQRKKVSVLRVVNLLVEPLNSARKQAVVRVFRSLDEKETGYLPLKALECFYNTEAHPLVKAGRISRREVVEELMQGVLDFFLIHVSSR
jgi:Ca2+-binding EF-hand superfamily protein